MSYSSKRTLVSLIAGAVLLAAYLFYAFGGSAPEPGDLSGWAAAMLVFIGIGAAAVIVIQILFHIAFAIGIAGRERTRDDKTVDRIFSAEVAEDERDNVIRLKVSRAGSIICGFGFIAALAALALGAAAIAALHILLGAFFAGSFAEGIASIFYYERGVRG